MESQIDIFRVPSQGRPLRLSALGAVLLVSAVVLLVVFGARSPRNGPASTGVVVAIILACVLALVAIMMIVSGFIKPKAFDSHHTFAMTPSGVLYDIRVDVVAERAAMAAANRGVGTIRLVNQAIHASSTIGAIQTIGDLDKMLTDANDQRLAAYVADVIDHPDREDYHLTVRRLDHATVVGADDKNYTIAYSDGPRNTRKEVPLFRKTVGVKDLLSRLPKMTVADFDRKYPARAGVGWAD